MTHRVHLQPTPRGSGGSIPRGPGHSLWSSLPPDRGSWKCRRVQECRTVSGDGGGGNQGGQVYLCTPSRPNQTPVSPTLHSPTLHSRDRPVLSGGRDAHPETRRVRRSYSLSVRSLSQPRPGVAPCTPVPSVLPHPRDTLGSWVGSVIDYL